MKKKAAKTSARKPSAVHTGVEPGKVGGIKRRLLEMRDDLIRTVRTQQLEESAEQEIRPDVDSPRGKPFKSKLRTKKEMVAWLRGKKEAAIIYEENGQGWCLLTELKGEIVRVGNLKVKVL